MSIDRNSLFRAITGRSHADTSDEDNITGSLIAAFGASSRDPHRPDVTTAAKRLKVDPSTVRRWLRNETKPNQHNRAHITQRARQAATTKRGRTQAAASMGRFSREGIRVTVKGEQGPQAGKQYMRRRTTYFDLDGPELTQGFIDAYIERGEAGAADYLSQTGLYYGPSWTFDSIDNFGITDVYNRPDDDWDTDNT